MSEYQKEAIRIIELIKNEFVLSDGSLCLAKNYITGQKFNKKIWLDLGDWLPFFLYFKEYKFVNSQVDLLSDYLEDN